MREFVVVGHDAPTDPAVALDNLAGAGRLDLLCRAVSAAVFTSHDIRPAVRIHLVHQDTLTITVDSTTLRNARPDERSIAGLVTTGLDAAADAIGHQPAKAAPGITVRSRGFQATLTDLATDGTVCMLHETGTPVTDISCPDHPVFVLSDHQAFTDDEDEFLTDTADEVVRLSPETVHTDHAITLAHHWLDTNGFTEW